ncbi:MAG: hypothetical protein VB858_03645 [Planctomycetaceae bacterium]
MGGAENQSLVQWLTVALGEGLVGSYVQAGFAVLVFYAVLIFNGRARRLLPWTYVAACLPGVLLMFLTLHFYVMVHPLDPSHGQYFGVAVGSSVLAFQFTLVLLFCAACVRGFLRIRARRARQGKSDDPLNSPDRTVQLTLRATGGILLLLFALAGSRVFMSYTHRVVIVDEASEPPVLRSLAAAAVDELTVSLIAGVAAVFILRDVFSGRRGMQKIRTAGEMSADSVETESEA